MSVRRFPSGSEYVEALQNPTLCFTDAELQSATLQVDKLRRPKPISGNFASVFSVQTVPGKRYAIKCFTRDVPDQEKRYRAVSERLNALPYRWKMDFDYQPSGIMVGGQRFPILRMEWVEAISLIRWIEDHLGDQAALLDLARRFAELAADLHREGIAHGDLQHGNLLVAADGTLKLVDYDGMYVPALSGLPATERGHRHYQSPHRTGAEFGPELDRFSVWLIYLSLVTVALDPMLWQVLHERDGEHLLLTDEDFVNMTASARVTALVGHQAADIKRLATYITDLASRPLPALPPLTPLPGFGHPSTVGAHTGSHVMTPPSTAASAGLPTWMSGHIPVPPSPPPITFQNHRAALLPARLALLGLYLVVALVMWLSGLPEVTALLGMLLGIGMTRALYALRPETKARKPIASRLEAVRRRAKKTLRAVAQSEKERDKIQMDNAKRADAHAKELQALKGRQKQDLGTYDRQTAQQLNPHDNQIQTLVTRKSEDLRRALEELQLQKVDAYLRRITLRSSSISGIGDTIVARLAVSGISTPADLVGFDYVSTGYQNPEVHLILANGSSIHVPGVGESRAASLVAWRDNHVQRALQQPNMPRALPASQRNAIEARFASEESVLKDRRAQTEMGRQKGRSNLVQQQANALQQLTDRHSAAAQTAAQALQNANQRLATMRAEHHSVVQEEQTLARQVAAYRQISYRRYLRTVLLGR
ncbi:protein kinase domain-containing protein [Streptosporangium saharense]|uniref:protein kinase domain-containing protein n=1 Tax=Streptosporangium saharense TaxID=1706840 RepID=UPI0036B9854B